MEITLATSHNKTAVCCLSSLNLAKYDEWKDTTLVEDLVTFLDNVLQYFIILAPKCSDSLHKAVYSATQERSIGLGTLGFHSLMQQKGYALDSRECYKENYYLYKSIQEKAYAQSELLGTTRGVPNDCAGSGFRNAHLLSVAPNASSASIVNASPSIEPWASNCFNAQGRAGSFLVKNKELEKVLETLGQNTTEVWGSILSNDGSVQHLEFLDEKLKEVFKTFKEVSMKSLIDLAATRQEFICQSQSLNIKVTENITLQEMSDIHFYAWATGVKTMYYCRAEAPTKTVAGGYNTNPLNSVKVDMVTCKACEG